MKNLSSISTEDLLEELRSRKNTASVIYWQKGDIINALNEAGYLPTEDRVEIMMEEANVLFNDHSDTNERLIELADHCGFSKTDLINTSKLILKAVDIQWSGPKSDIEDLPTEIEIPDDLLEDEIISDYLSDVTGFCHKGFNLVFAFKDENRNGEMIYES